MSQDSDVGTVRMVQCVACRAAFDARIGGWAECPSCGNWEFVIPPLDGDEGTFTGEFTESEEE